MNVIHPSAFQPMNVITKFFRLIFDFTHDLWQNRFTICQLAKRDYQNRYIGSSLGFIWTIIQPIVMIFVMWNFDLVPEPFQFWFKMNPIFYIVNGYRNSLIYGIPFWQDLHKKLRPHFADVL